MGSSPEPDFAVFSHAARSERGSRKPPASAAPSYWDANAVFLRRGGIGDGK